MRVLIADDEPGVRTSLSELLKAEHDVAVASDGSQALALIEKQYFDLVISDHQMPKLTGLDLLAKVREVSPMTSFILMTAFGTVDQAVQAIQSGADDYFLKPFEFPEITHRVNRIVDARSWRNQRLLQQESGSEPRLIGKSKAIDLAREFVSKVAKVASPVLLLGPSGCGKEVLAHAIHDAGAEKDRPFIPINCASLSEQLMESELFGHEKGAFTGAANSKPGKFELASGGTLFLDEIGELPLGIQAKLLRVLQEKEFYRVGGVRQIKTDARVIAATHRPIKEMLQSGTFREDLFFRLNVLAFQIPSLFERQEDLPVFMDHFWNQLCRELKAKARLAPAAREILLKYSYPGNIRELRNVIERLIVLAPSHGLVGVNELPEEIKQERKSPGRPLWEPGRSLTEGVEMFEAQAIEDAMRLSGENQVKAAEMLQITRGTLQYKLKKYRAGIPDAA